MSKPDSGVGKGRILCVTSNLPRWQGDSTTPFVLHLAADLQALGWEVDLLAPHAPGTARREVLSGVRIERFRYLWPVSAQTVCYQGGALINLRKNPANKLKLPALVAAEIAAVSRRLLTRKYDLLHSHWILPQGFAGSVARTFNRIPHVVTAHGGDVFGLRGKMMQRFKRVALRRADAVTVNSSFTRSAVCELAPSIDRLETIPMGVTVEPLSDSGRRDAESIRNQYRRGDGPLLLFVGRIVEEKGVEDLLLAMVELRDEFEGVTAMIVGEGQDREEMQRQAAQLGLGERVFFTGWMEPERIPACLAAADIFVGPSRRAKDGWVEAQGLTFIEAMAAGTPVVATRQGGIVDSVLHEQTGLLVDERSPQQIAAAVRRLWRDPALRQTLSEQGRAVATSRFSRGTSAEMFSSLFESLTQRT